ncbi:G patch domain-containing protein 3 [Patella vulgata]|uniref:G patch domain-containing protein 3 n=1 Tax=Patella vulgata TaxID=6465 RepID=UPI00217F85AD|nr:G patch domain-containing protein 3 [Patella vulgata]
MASDSDSETCIAVVNNIPPFYHSVDLRNFFSQFIESGRFDCFHFRHRPEKQKPSKVTQYENLHESVNKNESSSKTSTTCCVIRVKRHNLDDLLRLYNKANWLAKSGDSLASVCYISEIRLDKKNENTPTATCKSASNASNDFYQTRNEKKKIPEDRTDFTESDLMKLPELNPPQMMPYGNIGTPTKIFLKFIRECRLPPKIIQKLGLQFPRTKPRKMFGSVPFDYGSEVNDFTNSSDSESEIVSPQEDKSFLNAKNRLSPSKTSTVQQVCENSTHLNSKLSETEIDLSSVPIRTKLLQDKESDASASVDTENDYLSKRMAKKAEKRRIRELKAERIEEKLIGDESESEEDNDDCEEWERHEANYDDPSNQARNNERLFEERIELKWEKGGSGLVFYTDAQYWKKFEGDFDEQCADDWDVDMSSYYEDGAGDKDARDLITMRQEKRRRDGIASGDRFLEGKIGKFEKYTKGVGRKIMENQGWKDGQGLGTATNSGIVDALENDGQHPRNKKGLGFNGEKLKKICPSFKKKAKNDHLITTIYDDPSVTDPTEPLLRRNEPYIIKHTPGISHIEFMKSCD